MSANTLKTSGGGNTTPHDATDAALTKTGLMGDCNILTLQGYKPIETLRPGDRIITRSGLRELRAVKTETAICQAIHVKTGTLGFNRPSCDMRMAPGQQVMVRDWRAEVLFGRDAVIIPIGDLRDQKFISDEAEPQEHMLYALEFDAEEVFYADGVELLSHFASAHDRKLDLADAA